MKASMMLGTANKTGQGDLRSAGSAGSRDPRRAAASMLLSGLVVANRWDATWCGHLLQKQRDL
ncbi:MAG TPA: hypothetical protein PLF81_00125 [Candidatus Anammoximicrobium sp.]|nr:hypothetical protein [Candidatus Anammoximicrobium sp.]